MEGTYKVPPPILVESINPMNSLMGIENGPATRQGSARSMSFLEKDCEEPVIDPEVGGDGRMISERPTISGIAEKRPTESRGLHQ